MPYINTKVSCSISPQQEKELKAKLGKAITNVGKSEGWLMLNFEDNCRLWFKGDNSKPIAYVDIALFGAASASQYDAMTAEVTKIISDELGISPGCIYVKYDEVSTWGWNSNNF